MSTSETITRADLTNILNEVLPVPPLNELIYSGSFTAGTATLQKSVANYVKILIVYEDNDNTIHTKVVITNRASAFTTICSVLRVTGMDYKKGIIVSFNGTSMNVQNNKQGAGTATPTDGSFITIKNVYGVRAIDSDAIAEQADFVVEQGSGWGGYYRKWNSGKAEYWYNEGSSSGLSTAVWREPIWYGDYSRSNLWSGLFNSTPRVCASSNHQWVIGVIPYSITQDGCYLRYLTIGQASGQAYGAALYVVGTWK